MSTLDRLRQTRIEELRVKIRHLQDEMEPFVVTRNTDDQRYVEAWEAAAALQEEAEELQAERYAERASIVDLHSLPDDHALPSAGEANDL